VPVRVPPKTVKLKQKQSTAWITLNRPDKLNAINTTMLNELTETLDNIDRNPDIKCAIIIGEGERAFSAGADITELQKLTPQTAREFSKKGQQAFSKVEILSKPVIAAINGYALGGGLELALACDFRLASHHAELGLPEMKLGIIPGWGGTQRLTWTIGAAEAKRLIMLGDLVKAEEAARLRLVNKVVPQNRLEAEAEKLAQRLSRCLPTALKHAKYAINSVTQSCLEAGLTKETDLFVQLFSKKETKERLKGFLSKRNKKERDTTS
jgi:enoyl-CoA hydratase/carnithine racemase